MLGAVVAKEALDVAHHGDGGDVGDEDGELDAAVHEVEPNGVHGERRRVPVAKELAQPVGRHVGRELEQQERKPQPKEHGEPDGAVSGLLVAVGGLCVAFRLLKHGLLGGEVEGAQAVIHALNEHVGAA